LADQDPLVTVTELHEDVGELTYSVRDFYQQLPAEDEPPPGLDGDLRAIFDDLQLADDQKKPGDSKAAGALIRGLERQLMADVFRWTGHFPERTRSLMRYLAKRADELQQVYLEKFETEAVVAVTILVTSLAMNYVHRGGYFPEPPSERT